MVVYSYNDEFKYIRLSEIPSNKKEGLQEFVAFKNRPLVFDKINKRYIEDAVFLGDFTDWMKLSGGDNGKEMSCV
jgi:hypothetical protein